MNDSRSVTLMILGTLACGGISAVSVAAEPAPASKPAESRPAGDVEDIPRTTELLRLGGAATITQHDFEQFAIGLKPGSYDRAFVSLLQQKQLTLFWKDHPGLVSDAEVDKPIEDAVKKGRSREEVIKRMESKGMSLGFWRERMRAHLIRTALVRQGEAMGKDTEFRKKAFEKDPAAYNGTKVFVRHLLILAPPYLPPAERDRKRQIADRIRADLAAGKIDWAKAYAQSDGLVPNQGELGWITRHTDVNEPVAGAAFAIKPKEVAPVVESGLGFHVVQVLERTDGARAVDNEETIRAMQLWLQQATLYDAIKEVESKYPPVGVRPPARTPYMAEHEFNRPPPMLFGSPTPATAPAK